MGLTGMKGEKQNTKFFATYKAIVENFIYFSKLVTIHDERLLEPG